MSTHSLPARTRRATQSEIDLAWTEGADLGGTAASYTIERAPDDGSNPPNWQQIASPQAPAGSYPDANGLTADTSYLYRMSASNAWGTSDFSSVVTGKTLPPPPAPPLALTATAASATQVNLSWQPGDTTATGFKIQRSTNPNFGWTQVLTAGANGANAETATDSTCRPSTTYYYRIAATNRGGDSAWTYANPVTTLAPPPPAAPSGLTATAPYSTEVDLSWTDNSANATDGSNATGFEIQRHNGPSGSAPFAPLATVAASPTAYADKSVSASSTYTYRVRAIGQSGDSAFTSDAVVTTPATPAIVGPAGPPVVTLAVASSATSINVYWNPASGASSYKIYRDTVSGGPGVVVASPVPTSGNEKMQSFVDAACVTGTIYYYTVTSVTGGVESSRSPESGHWANSDAMPLNGSASDIVSWGYRHQDFSDENPPAGSNSVEVLLPDGRIADGATGTFLANATAPAVVNTNATIIGAGGGADTFITTPRAGSQLTFVSSSVSYSISAQINPSVASYLKAGTDLLNPAFAPGSYTLLDYIPDGNSPTKMFLPNSVVKQEAANIYVGIKEYDSPAPTVFPDSNGNYDQAIADVEVGFQMDHYGTYEVEDFRWTPYFRSAIANSTAGHNNDGNRYQMVNYMQMNGEQLPLRYFKADYNYSGLGQSQTNLSARVDPASKMVIGKVSAQLYGVVVCLVSTDEFKVDPTTKMSVETRVKAATGLDQVVDMGFVGFTGTTGFFPITSSTWVAEPEPTYYKWGHVRTQSALEVYWDTQHLMTAHVPLGPMSGVDPLSSLFLMHETRSVSLSQDGPLMTVDMNNH